MNKAQRDITRYLNQFPVEHTFDPSGKHPRIILSYEGRSEVVTLGRSPSDHRSSANARSDIKRAVTTLLASASPRTTSNPKKEKPTVEVTSPPIEAPAAPKPTTPAVVVPEPEPTPTTGELWLEALHERFFQEGCLSPIVSTETITPEIAAYLLEQNPNNRKINQTRVREIAADIVSDRWKLNGETVIFADTSELNDGQHRLWAIIEANKPIKTLVVYGVARDSRTTTDLGTARKVTDLLVMNQIPNATVAAAVAAYLRRYEQAGTIDHRQVVLSKADITTYYDANAGDIQRCIRLSWVGRTGLQVGSVSLVAFLAVVFSRAAGWEAAEAFWEAFRTGADLDTGSPILYARNRLASDRNLTIGTRAEMIIRVWNLWRESKTINQYMKLTGSLPKAI